MVGYCLHPKRTNVYVSLNSKNWVTPEGRAIFLDLLDWPCLEGNNEIPDSRKNKESKIKGRRSGEPSSSAML